MVKRNENFAKLQAGYLFPEITRRKNKLLQEQPAAKIISLGIGNTTEPLTPHIAKALSLYAAGLGTAAGYSGYGEEQGMPALRAKIAERYYRGLVKKEEVYISDGAKCDISRLQLMFGPRATFAVQDPSYPVYVDGGVITGQTGAFQQNSRQFEGIIYMPCTPENNFFPDLSKTPRTDIIYWCSPNNPTGAVSSREQLQALVAFARKNRSIIIFDAAYAMFIKDSSLPKSIFEIEGARDAAIEVNSFSKPAGFTGVRLGWSVVPESLRFDDGAPVANDWTRVATTLFNGASNIAQHGGLAALDETGFGEMQQIISFYGENAALIKTTLTELGFESWGGENAPYIWARLKGKDSWAAFEEILYKAHIVTTPGAGFGPAGEGFLRFSAFGHRTNILEATKRLRTLFG